MKKIHLVIFVVLAMVPFQAGADTAFFNTNITRVLVTGDDEFGGCMVRPAASMENALDCRVWATMDCAGALGGTKSEGNRKFDTAQLANIMGKKLGLTITDDKKINGWCFVERVAFTN